MQENQHSGNYTYQSESEGEYTDPNEEKFVLTRQEVENLREQSEEQDRIIEEKEAQIQKLKIDIENYEQAQMKEEQSGEAYKNMMLEQQNSIESLQEQLQLKETEIQEQRDELDIQRQQNESVVQNLDILQRSHDQMMMQHEVQEKNMLDEIDRLKMSLKKNTDKTTGKIKDWEEFKEKKQEEYERRYQKQEEEKQELRQNISKLNEKVRELTDELQCCQSSLNREKKDRQKDMMEANKSHDDQINKLQKQLTKFEEKYNKQLSKSKNAKNQIKELFDQINDMKLRHKMEIEAEKAENMLKTATSGFHPQELIQDFSDLQSQKSLASNAADPNNDLLKIDFVDTNNQINIGQMVEGPRASATSSQYQTRNSLKSQIDDNIQIHLENNEVIHEVEDDLINQSFRSHYTASVIPDLETQSVQEMDQQLQEAFSDNEIRILKFKLMELKNIFVLSDDPDEAGIDLESILQAFEMLQKSRQMKNDSQNSSQSKLSPNSLLSQFFENENISKLFVLNDHLVDQAHQYLLTTIQQQRKDKMVPQTDIVSQFINQQINLIATNAMLYYLFVEAKETFNDAFNQMLNHVQYLRTKVKKVQKELHTESKKIKSLNLKYTGMENNNMNLQIQLSQAKEEKQKLYDEIDKLNEDLIDQKKALMNKFKQEQYNVLDKLNSGIFDFSS